MDSPYVTDLIILWHLRRIAIRGLAFRLFSRPTLSGPHKSYRSTFQSIYLHCWINIPSCSSKELRPEMSHGSVTLLNSTRYLHAGMRKRFQGSARNFDQKSYDYGVFRSAKANCPGFPPSKAEMQPRTVGLEHTSIIVSWKEAFCSSENRDWFFCAWTTRCATMSIELSMNYVAWRFSELSIDPTCQTSVRANFGYSEISKENWRTAVCKTRKKPHGISRIVG
jgi:hypothetical protein